MDQSNTVYAISGRMKNLLAMAGISLTPVGTILINSYTHVLKSLYDFAENLEGFNERASLEHLLLQAESLPKSVIELTIPKEGTTLYDDITRLMPMYPSNEDALADMIAEYEYCGGEEFWVEAESAILDTEEYSRIRTLRRGIGMCQYLVNKNKNKALSGLEVPLIEHREDE